jgi:hypothetical protein
MVRITAGFLVLIAASLVSCGFNQQILTRNDRAMAIKPEGVTFVDTKRRTKLGPPPYEYWRILGHPVPSWDAEPNAGQGGFADRGTPFSWTFIGPRPVSSEYWSYEGNAGGRVVSIAPHPTDANTVYIGTASGGVWKSTNGGTTWTPKTDELPSLNTGVVALDPSDPQVVLVGTGEYQTGSLGDGVFRSIDGGGTWQRIATSSVGRRCSGLAVSSASSDVIHFTGDLGYWRTTNRGANWSRVLSGSASALEVDPVNPQRVFAAVDGVGIYRSTNGGATMTLLTSGLPTSGFNRIVMDMSRSNPSIMVAAFLSGGNVAAVRKTVDGGNTWTIVTMLNFCAPQCYYDAYLAIDPADPNRMFAGGVDPRYASAGVLRSINGGTTWTEVSAGGNGLHPDHHAMAFGPNGVIWEGNDGGISKSTNGGTTWMNMNTTLAATQSYDVVVHPTQADRVLQGTQDNGTPERTSASFTWPQLQTGDGGQSAFDPTLTTRRYTTYVYGTLYRWLSSTATDITGGWTGDAANFIAPFVIDPSSSTRLLVGTNRVWRTNNASTTTPTWTAISTSSVANGGSLNTLAIAPSNSATIYTGSSEGSVWVSTNGTATSPTWTNRTGAFLGRSVSKIVVHPTNPSIAYIGRYITTGSRIQRTADLGVTYTDVTGTLPSGAPVNTLAVDFAFTPPVMYVGAGSGVYVSFDHGATWIKDDATFPNVNIGSMTIHEPSRTLTVGTYGRGVWRTPLAQPCLGDFNGDGGVDGDDVVAFFAAWDSGAARADVNGDGGVDGDDVILFFSRWDSGC